MIYVASDHGGFRMKQQLVRWLEARKLPVIDLGPTKLNPSDDYPLMAAAVARAARTRKSDRGIVICRSGVGAAIAANKIPGVRAVESSNPEIARRSRRDENTNVLSIGADFVSFNQAREIITAWLKTPYRPLARYERRLRQLRSLEHGR